MKQKEKKFSRWNILIAEDDLKNRALLVKSLTPLARCTTVDNGDAALKSYDKAIKKKEPFDFILLDVSMPGTDGFGVLRAIRKQEEDNKLAPAASSRIIMTTTYKDSLMENYNMGWDEYITKPIETDILIEKMKRMMGIQ